MVRVGLLLLGGCLVGGGPVIGYSAKSGGYLAFEASGGGAAVLPQLTLGVQENAKYVRLDVPADLTYVNPERDRIRPVGRIGGGVAFPDDGPTTGIFTAGFGGGEIITARDRCSGVQVVATVELQVRYLNGWSIALAPRIEGGYGACIDGDD